jgi:hypothetical protein
LWVIPKITHIAQRSTLSDRCTFVAGLGVSCRQLRDHAGRSVDGRDIDGPAGLAGGRPLNTLRLPKRGVWADAVDSETIEIIDGNDFARIELDYRVVQGVLAASGEGNSADRVAGLGGFGHNRCPGASATPSGEPDRFTAAVVTNRGQGAIGAADDDSRATAQNR